MTQRILIHSTNVKNEQKKCDSLNNHSFRGFPHNAHFGISIMQKGTKVICSTNAYSPTCLEGAENFLSGETNFWCPN